MQFVFNIDFEGNPNAKKYPALFKRVALLYVIKACKEMRGEVEPETEAGAKKYLKERGFKVKYQNPNPNKQIINIIDKLTKPR